MVLLFAGYVVATLDADMAEMADKRLAVLLLPECQDHPILNRKTAKL
jgi:hypothetical protein